MAYGHGRRGDPWARFCEAVAGKRKVSERFSTPVVHEIVIDRVGADLVKGGRAAWLLRVPVERRTTTTPK